MFIRLAEFLIDRRWAVLAVVLLATAAAGVVATGLRFDFTPQALFAGQGELLAFSEETKETFGHSENLILVVQQATGDDDLLTPEALQWHRKLAARLAETPAVIDVEALATIRIPRMRLFSSSLMYIPVIRDGPIDAEEAELVQRKIQHQPMLEGVLISRDRRAAAIFLHLDPARKDIVHLRRVIGELNEILEQTPSPDGYAAYVGGLPAMRVKIVEALKTDQLTIIELCVLLFALVQGLIFRHWAPVLISSCAVLVGLAWTFAALVLFDQPLTIISNILPILLMIVGVSSCVHFLNGYAEFNARWPDDRRRALIETITHLTLACFLTSLTTALGFLSLLAARSELLESLGWQAAMGILLFFVATVMICSTLLPLYRTGAQRRQRRHKAGSPLARLAWAAGRWATHHYHAVAVGSCLAMGLAALLGSRAEVDSRLIETFDDDHPVVGRMRLIEEKLGGFVPMELVIASDTPYWYLEPDHWRRLVAATEFAADQPGVLQVRSAVDIYGQIDRLLPGRPLLPADAAPDEADLARRLRDIGRLQERFANSGDIRSFATEDGRKVRILLRLRDLGTRRGQELADTIQDRLAELFPPAGDVTARVTGESYVAAVSLNSFITDLLYSLLGVSLLIFVVIGLVLRSPRLGILSIAPNVAPLVITLGYLELRGYSLNMGNVIVFAISLGVAVDDTIHFLARFRQEVRKHDLDTAIRNTCLGTGRAVLMTTILIVSGLTVLLLSSFVPTRRFAELATVTMISALLGDLLMLPALLKLFWKTPKTDEATTSASLKRAPVTVG